MLCDSGTLGCICSYSPVMNIDALLGETSDRELVYKGKTFTLPAEIPGACLKPFLGDDLGLVDLVIDAVKTWNEGEDWFDNIITAATTNRSMPKEFFAALHESFKILLGDQYEPLMAERPGVNFYVAFARNVPNEYGLSLDFLASTESSPEIGTDSNPTLPDTIPESTPEISGVTEPVAPEPDPVSV